MAKYEPWIGFDLDGTLAHHEHGQDIDIIGKPIPRMVNRLKRYIKQGHKVKILTARAGKPGQNAMIKKWLRDNGLPNLEITNAKDHQMIKLFDDRAVAVQKNTGKIMS